MYYVSYGPQHVSCSTLKVARDAAKRIARDTIYAINIVHNGDVVETWTPKINKSGRVTFQREIR